VTMRSYVLQRVEVRAMDRYEAISAAMGLGLLLEME